MKKSTHKLITITGIIVMAVMSCEEDENKNNVIDDSANYTVTTIAGNGTNGMDSYTGGLALLYYPGNLALNSQGSIYVADGMNQRIREILPSGSMLNLAGSTLGYADGTGTEAQFNNPLGLCIDAEENLYVFEAGSPRIRKVTSAGVVTTIAGNGIAGFKDGVGTEAQIDYGGGITTDPNGNIYFTQKDFHGIRKISPSGAVSTFVGSSTPGYANGIGTEARFNTPYGLDSDADGNIYVSDFKNARIRKITPEGLVSSLVRRTNENEMHNIARDSEGNFYVVQGDATKVEIVKISTSNRMTKIAGGVIGFEDGLGNNAKFSFISGISTDAFGAVYVTDLLNNAIRKIERK